MKILDRADPLVRRLFCPFLHSDFVSTSATPKYSKIDLEWLHEHAYLFGISPSRLNLPPMSIYAKDSDSTLQSVNVAAGGNSTHRLLDRRQLAFLAREEASREEKEEKRRSRELTMRRKSLHRVGGYWTEELQKDFDAAWDEERENASPPKIPLRLFETEKKNEFERERQESVATLMAGMNQRIQEWRTRRREEKMKRKQANSAI